MRHFVVIGQRATASPDFLLVDIPSTSGRLDVLLRCLRAAMLVSHGVRRDATTYLVLLGGPNAPRTVRFDGSAARYLRPDERSLATVLQKALATECTGAGFVAVRTGVAVASGGLDVVLADLPEATLFMLDEAGSDLRDPTIELRDAVFFVGDHVGFDETVRAQLTALGARILSVGPLTLQAEDVVTIVGNELDRREHVNA
jgi:tRNA (pseudouridine54-N1)-methyltransferase